MISGTSSVAAIVAGRVTPQRSAIRACPHTATYGEAGEAVLARVHGVAREAARLYGLPDAEVTLINVSENATYRIDDPVTGERRILRVHRLGYHAVPAILSELAWLDALRCEAGVRTPEVIPGPGGRRVLTVPGERPRDCVMFEFLPGAEPPQDDSLVAGFERLGALTA
ncbi:phosphotransferase enzyme family protein, partial [Streptosporangium algeriense]